MSAPTDRVAFYVVDAAGVILRQGVCQRADAAGQNMAPDWTTQKMAAEGAVVVEPAPVTFKDASGVVVAISGLTHRYDAASLAFVPIIAVIPPEPPAPTLADLKAAKLASAGDAFNGRLAAGLGYAGEVVDMDGDSRTNLTAMAVMALEVTLAGAAWPDDYAKGWVARSGLRIPLPTATDGKALSFAASALYSAAVQHGTDLAVAIAAAPDAASLAAIDTSAGWPG